MMRLPAIVLLVGCYHAVPSRYVEGASQCSMVPVTRQCQCDGTERMPSAAERAQAYCGATLMICEGTVHDCVAAPP
jgi:hypothetical protein